MTSFRQIEANRHNALKSTGPRTENGKQQFRRNALRHGFTAETVIEPLESPEEYRAFEEAIVSEYLATNARRGGTRPSPRVPFLATSLGHLD
jgi:hypothetical protein